MTIVKISLHKVNAERNLNSKGGQVKINNNVSIKDISEMDFEAGGKKGLKFTFSFNCTYAPDLGKMEVEGQVLYVEEEKKITEIKEQWDKERKISYDVMEQIINAALHKGNIQAIKISEDVSLPSPLPLPKVRAGPNSIIEKTEEVKASVEQKEEEKK